MLGQGKGSGCIKKKIVRVLLVSVYGCFVCLPLCVPAITNVVVFSCSVVIVVLLLFLLVVVLVVIV